MRLIICGLGLLLLQEAVATTAGYAQVAVQLPNRDRVRLAEAIRVSGDLGDRLWPGWGSTPLAVLLVTDSAEFLIGHPQPTADFAPLGHDALLGRAVWTRPRQFSPTLLATFPAVGGIPTVVIGSAERTGKSSTGWVLTLLHEHFHQWQYTRPDYYPGVARLNLANGDTTGQWMLDYPFPYHSQPVRQAMRRLALALVRTLEVPSSIREQAVRDVIHARERLRGSLTEADYRYFEFQLWQEGVARFIEYAAAGAAGILKEPSREFRSLADYESYGKAAGTARRRLGGELKHLDLKRHRRTAFYPIGAAMALVLEETRSDWKAAYAERPFALAALLGAGR
jgi:hypothetical protein